MLKIKENIKMNIIEIKRIKINQTLQPLVLHSTISALKLEGKFILFIYWFLILFFILFGKANSWLSHIPS